jgi:hypothetical protein
MLRRIRTEIQRSADARRVDRQRDEGHATMVSRGYIARLHRAARRLVGSRASEPRSESLAVRDAELDMGSPQERRDGVRRQTEVIPRNGWRNPWLSCEAAKPARPVLRTGRSRTIVHPCLAA